MRKIFFIMRFLAVGLGFAVFASCLPDIPIIGKEKPSALMHKSQSVAKKVLTIPAGTTHITKEKYANKRHYTDLVIPDSVISIGEGAFSVNDFSSITIPKSVITIGKSAFSYSIALTHLIISNSVTTIGKGAFFNSKKLKSVVIGASVTTIGDNAFKFAFKIPYNKEELNRNLKITLSKSLYDKINKENRLKNVFGEGNIKYDFYTVVKDIGIIYPDNNKLVIKDGVTTIGAYALKDKNLTQVVIPDSVTTIEEGAFINDKLSSLILGSSVITIGKQAFANNKIQALTIPDSITTIGEGAFEKNEIRSITLKSSVTTIGKRAFADNILNQIDISNLVTTTSIGEKAFLSNASIIYTPEVTLPKVLYDVFVQQNRLAEVFGPKIKFYNLVNVVSTGKLTSRYSASDSQNLVSKKLLINKDVTTIKEDAFTGQSLTEVSIPDSVTTIGDRAFKNNPSLTKVTIPDALHKTLGTQGRLTTIFGDQVTAPDDFYIKFDPIKTVVYMEVNDTNPLNAGRIQKSLTTSPFLILSFYLLPIL